MVTSDFVVDQTPGRAELRSATTCNGAQFAMMHGELLMLTWPVDSLVSLQQVFIKISILINVYKCNSEKYISSSPFSCKWVIISIGGGENCKVFVLNKKPTIPSEPASHNFGSTF